MLRRIGTAFQGQPLKENIGPLLIDKRNQLQRTKPKEPDGVV